MTLLQSTEISLPIHPGAGVLYTFLFTLSHLCMQYWANLRRLFLGSSTAGSLEVVTPSLIEWSTLSWAGVREWVARIPTYTSTIVLSNSISSYYGCIPYMTAIYIMNYHVVYGITKQFIITIL